MTESKPRRRRGCLRCLLVVILLLAGLAALGLYLSSRLLRGAAVEAGSVLEVTLAGGLAEGPARDLFQELTGRAGGSLWEVRTALRRAAEDARIVGVRLAIRTTDLGWAAGEELLSALDRFRASGKPVYAEIQSDMLADFEYFLATGADRIWLAPETGVLVNGLAAEVEFLRGTLEKLHIEPEVIMFKEYKSAGEMFLNREMSEPMREAMAAYLATIDERFRQRVAERRQVPVEALAELLARGIVTAQDLLERGLVDAVGYPDEVEAAFEELDEVSEYRGIGLEEYLGAIAGGERPAGDTIALVFGEGLILAEPLDAGLFGMGGWLIGPEVASHLREAAEAESVRAIVFRVNSRGGSAVGSDAVRREIRRARDAGVPVVVSMSSVAGSGGYWVAADADAIVAHPTTLTGSIGVVFTKFDLTGFFDWIGLNVETLKTAPYADILGYAPLDEERRGLVMSWMDAVYESFKGHVAEGRELAPERLEEIARGRVWSGADAMQIGLIDRLGGLDEALAMAKEAAGLDPEAEYPVEIFPRRKPLLQRLLEGEGLVSARGLPTEAALREAVRKLGRPQVLAQAPAVRVR